MKNKSGLSGGYLNKPLGIRIKLHTTFYLFLLPIIAYHFIFSYIPIYGVQIAFKNYNTGLGIWGSRWVGLRHFRDFLFNYNFVNLVGNTLVISLYSLAASFPIPVLLALMLNEMRALKYKKTLQTIMYAPHFISMVVLCGMITLFLSPSMGIVNNALEFMGFGRYYFMAEPDAFKHVYVWSGVWQNAGWGTIIYLAALSAVDTELHEAAIIDGASRLRRIWHINLVAIKPTVTILLILNIGSLIGVGFEKAYLLQNFLNLSKSEVISTYVYRRGILNGSFSYASAVGLLNNAANLILLFTANYISKKIGETSFF